MRFNKRLRKKQISIHALREEGDFPASSTITKGRNFYPRPPRGGRQNPCEAVQEAQEISIHALREEGDSMLEAISEPVVLFLSTPSARRATTTPQEMIAYFLGFLSTPSARRATLILLGELLELCISIHALREEGDNKIAGPYDNVLVFLSTPSARRATRSVLKFLDRLEISIHALREEGDRSAGGYTTSFNPFLSTPSARRATTSAA